MFEFLKGKYLGVFSFLFTTLLFFIIYLVFNIRFEENDDIMMGLIASGQYSGVPDHHLVFSNVIYGYLLKSLYSVYSTLEWYTIIQVLINIISTSVLSLYLIRSELSKFLKGAFLFLLYSIFIGISIKLQFTYTSGLIGIAGICLLYRNKSHSQLLLGCLMVLLAALIRDKVSFLILLISCPVLLFYKNTLKEIFSSRELIYLGIFVVGILGSTFTNNKAHNLDKDWAYYRAYNTIRGGINDNPNARNIKGSLPDNITEGDYNLLLTAFVDSKRMNLESIKEIKPLLAEVPFFSKLSNIRKVIKPYYAIWLFIMFLIALLFTGSKESKHKYIPLIIFAILLIGLSYLSLNKTVKNRVFIIAVGTYLFMLPLLIPKLKLSLQTQRVLGILVLVLGLVLNVRTIFRYDGNEFPEKYNIQHTLLDEYLGQGNKKITPYGTSLMLEYGNPFHISKDYFSGQVYFTGWLTHIPFNKGNFDSFEFFTEGNALYITKLAYKSVVDILVESIRVNYKEKVHPVIILESETDYIVEFVKD